MADVELSTLGSVIKTAYEAEADTNAYTDADAALVASALQDVVSDTTPQLGGSLDVNGNKIVSASNGNIDIEPNGTGNVLLGNFTFDADQTVGAGQDNYVLTYDNATGLISLEAASGGGSGDFLADGTVDMTGEFRTDVGTFDSDVADGASANAYTFNTAATYSTAGANLLRLQNNATNVFDFSFQGGIDHVNSGASTAAHSQSLNLNWSSSSTATSSGQYSAVIGSSNRASGINSVAVGAGTVASGNWTFAANSAVQATGDRSTAFGDTTVVSGAAGFVSGVRNNVSGAYSAGFGTRALVTNANTLGVGGSGTDGMQSMVSTLYVATTDATQTTLQSNSTNFVIPADATWAFSALVVGRSDETDGNDSAAYEIKGVLTRDESNNTALVGSITKTVLAESAGATAWDATIEADDTNEALAIKVTGEAGTNIRWVAKVDIAQVIYA